MSNTVIQKYEHQVTKAEWIILLKTEEKISLILLILSSIYIIFYPVSTIYPPIYSLHIIFQHCLQEADKYFIVFPQVPQRAAEPQWSHHWAITERYLFGFCFSYVADLGR